MSVIMMHVAGPKVKSVFSFCFFSALRRGWVCRHLALGLVQNRQVVRSRVFAASAALGTRVGLSSSRPPLVPRAASLLPSQSTTLVDTLVSTHALEQSSRA